LRRARPGRRPRMSNMVQAIRMALHVGEARHRVTDTFGEGVGPPLGGAFTATQGLKTAWNTPLDERGVVGTSIGLGLAGCRNVAEIQFCDYAFNTIDLLKLAGMQYWASNGTWNCPITIMTPVGSGIRGSIYHSHSFDTTATHIPGFKIAIPSTPLDAYGLLLSCILDPNPCFFLVPKALMRVRSLPGEEIPGEPGDDRALSKLIDAPLGDRTSWKPQWPDTPDHFVPFGEGRTVRAGRDLTVVSYGRTFRASGWPTIWKWRRFRSFRRSAKPFAHWRGSNHDRRRLPLPIRYGAGPHPQGRRDAVAVARESVVAPAGEVADARRAQ